MTDHDQPLLISPGEGHQDVALLERQRTIADYEGENYSPHLCKGLRAFMEANLIASKPIQVRAFPEDLTAGKNTHVYDAHTYHTKVPPEAIRRVIEHYTNATEVVLDPFCGSGMTGVAAIQASRVPVLIDLSPAATFIALNFLTPVNPTDYMRAVSEILAMTREEELSLYTTHCRTCGKPVPIEYMVWSYVVTCSDCGAEFQLWDVARDERESVRESKIRTDFDCPSCGKHLIKRKLSRREPYPVEVGYYCCNGGLQESKAPPEDHDIRLVNRTNREGIPGGLWYPRAPFPDGINTRQPVSHGITSVDALYTARNLRAVARLWDIASRWPDKDIGLKLMFTVTSLYQRVTRLSEFRFWGGSGNIANYNVPMISNEQNVFRVFHRKAKTIRNYFASCAALQNNRFCISTQSATNLVSIPDNSIDYIFTDPPFGGNINYSEMNYLWEAWLQVYTDTGDEAIINRVMGKTLDTYRELMTRSLREMFRVLKPNRWMTLVFHNSSSKVWSAIQGAVSASGFSIESTQILDKRHGTFKQFVSENAVGYDLMIHCTKDLQSNGFRIHTSAGSDAAAIMEFLKRTIIPDREKFLVHYQHVDREDELDFRRLYSLWLKEEMGTGHIVDLDFDQFRGLVDKTLKTLDDDGLETSGGQENT